MLFRSGVVTDIKNPDDISDEELGLAYLSAMLGQRYELKSALMFLILVDGRIVVDDNEEGVAVLRLDSDELLIGCLGIEPVSYTHLDVYKRQPERY